MSKSLKISISKSAFSLFSFSSKATRKRSVDCQRGSLRRYVPVFGVSLRGAFILRNDYLVPQYCPPICVFFLMWNQVHLSHNCACNRDMYFRPSCCKKMSTRPPLSLRLLMTLSKSTVTSRLCFLSGDCRKAVASCQSLIRH